MALEKRSVSRWERLILPYKLMVWPHVQGVAKWTGKWTGEILVNLLGLGNRRWYRKLKGGKWERWYADYPVVADVWYRVDQWTNLNVVTGPRPGGLLRGRPTLEQDGVRLYENRCGKCDVVAEVSTKCRDKILCTACDVLFEVDAVSYNEMYRQMTRPRLPRGRIVRGP